MNETIPAFIRVDGLTIDDDAREHIRRKLNANFARHARSVQRVSVRLRDINGPRGGLDIQCRIKVVLSGLPSVVVELQAEVYRVAFSGALAAAERAVRRALQRRRLSPIRALAFSGGIDK
jgi:hypothetical protein